MIKFKRERKGMRGGRKENIWRKKEKKNEKMERKEKIEKLMFKKKEGKDKNICIVEFRREFRYDWIR